MKKFLIAIIVSIALSIILFVVVIVVGKKQPMLFGAQKIGSWKYSNSTGNENANLYIKAFINLTGILALNKSETIYLSAGEDIDGNSLNTSNTYKITGNEIAGTRWWSITAYKNNYLIKNSQNVYSFSKTSIQKDSLGNFVIMLSPKKQHKNWIPTGQSVGNFDLVLRCYNPSKELIKQIENGTIELPTIKKIY